MKNQKNQKNQKSNSKAGMLTTIVVWAVIILTPLTIIYWGNVKSFFATTPQAKCEALIKASNKDAYCTVAGERRSHKADAFAQEKRNCQTRAPYFIWSGETSIVAGHCERVRYESKQACIDDSRQGARTVQLPKDEGGGAVVTDTWCFDDGTWRVMHVTE